MLQSLRVRNFAIVENAGINFEPGLNVITGETGAGKSILTGALGLLLGARADKALIRTGEEQCTIEAVFSIEETAAVDAVLEEYGLPACEEGQLIIRRTVSQSGSGKLWLNDSPTTLQTLKTLGTLLVDQHGPHDHQSLLDPAFQRELLDAFGHHDKLLSEYHSAYRSLSEITGRLSELQGSDEDILRQIDMLEFQTSEIAAAGLENLDEDALEQEHLESSSIQRILELGAEIEQALSESDQSAFSTAAAARQRLDELASLAGRAEAWRDEAASICIQIQELAASVSAYVQSLDPDPERLQQLEDRLALVNRLKRKYGPDLESVLTFYKEAAGKLADLHSRGEKLETLGKEQEAARQQVMERGKSLSTARLKAAKKLESTITTHIRELGFKHGQFSIAVTSGSPGPDGIDQVEFGFAPNVGEETRPLRLIASSGEISRVMLAVKAVLAQHDRIPVLVFDEIDANVGGEIANAVGAKMADVARCHQVLCITHLPQVAVFGTHHLVVSKQVVKARTQTTVQPVSGERREQEIARMLGGIDHTRVTLEHARELLAGTA